MENSGCFLELFSIFLIVLSANFISLSKKHLYSIRQIRLGSCLSFSYFQRSYHWKLLVIRKKLLFVRSSREPSLCHILLFIDNALPTNIDTLSVSFELIISQMNNKGEIKQTVYISFNNNDSSLSTFITYLVAAFYRVGIDVVSEKPGHELENGWFSHIKLFVVVFSKPCAYSVACLEKLVMLLEFLQKEGHVVVPVFSVAIANQKEKLSGAFEALGKSYSADQVTKWQRVLKETMGLKGHEYTNELRCANFTAIFVLQYYDRAVVGLEISRALNILVKEINNLKIVCLCVSAFP